MRVSPNQFVCDGSQRIGHLPSARFCRNLCVKDHLKQHIAQFTWKCLVVAPVERVECFVRFSQEKWPECLVGLFAVPRAPVRRAECGHDPHKAGHGASGFGGAVGDSRCHGKEGNSKPRTKVL